MSNKTIFQEKNTRLNSNNIDLSSILETINNLPSASGEINTDIEDAMVMRTLSGDYVNNRITTIGSEGLRATQITGLHCENVLNVGGEGLRDCQKLTYVYLPKCTTISSYGIGLCGALERAEFNNLTKIYALGFSTNSKMSTLIIRTPSVCELLNTSALTSTPIANGTGYVYVPDNLVSSYKTATNWSTYASQIKGLSELEG